jgi:type IV pilus assembly protein PilQ
MNGGIVLAGVWLLIAWWPQPARLSFDFQDIAVRQVLQLLAAERDMDLIVDEQVTGRLTLRLTQVTWERAWQVILHTQGLGYLQLDDVLLVAPLKDITQWHTEQQSLTQKTTLATELIPIHYASAASIAKFLTTSQGQLLGTEGTIQVDERSNVLWLQAPNHQLVVMKKIIAQLDIPVPQIHIAASIVAVNKDYSQKLGARLGIISRNLVGNDAKISPAAIPGVDRLQQELVSPGVAGQTNGVIVARLGGNILLDLELTALEREGQGEIIASPRLMTANKQTASIQAGAEIPFEEATSSGATAVTFKRAALRMEVTPQITPDDKVILQLEVTQDAPSPVRVNGVPLINTKAIQTQVLVGNGETIVLGGIMQQEEAQEQERIPLLSELPIIGRLFVQQVTRFKREELLVFITPSIIDEPVVEVE